MRKTTQQFLIALVLVGLVFPGSAAAEFFSDTVHGPILNHQTSYMYKGECTTDAQGECEVAVQVAGIQSAFSATYFNGYTTPVNPNGRYVQFGACQVEGGEQGDAVTALQVEDRVNKIPEAARPSFPSYPVLSRFFDPDAPAASQGWYLTPGQFTSIGSLGFPKFVAAPLHIVAKFKLKSAVAGRVVRCNYNMSKHEQVK